MTRAAKCPICLSSSVAVARHKDGFPICRCENCTAEYAVLTDADIPSYDAHYAPDNIYDGYHNMAKMATEKLDDRVLYWYQHRMLQTAGAGNGRLHVDIGSGLGTFSAVTRSKGWNVRGVDISKDAADQARKIFDIDTFVGDLRDIDLAPGSVDWFSAFEVLEHVMNPHEFIEIMRRLLKPGGLVTISVPNGKSRDEIFSTEPLNSPPTHINFFTRKALSMMFEELGFTKIYDYEKPIAWGELKTKKPARYFLLPLLALDAFLLGHRGNRLLWVGRSAQR